MKILLLNENPVVTKLVTLSTQKTSDELEIITNLQDLKSQNYDLFAVDDALYTQEIFDEVKEKINFINSLYICSRDAETVDGFTEILRKPFLPTVIIELFSKLENTQKNTEKIQDGNNFTEPLENEVSTQDDGEFLDFNGNEDDIGEIDLADASELGSLDEPDLANDIEDVQLDAEQEDLDMNLDEDDLSDEDVNEEDFSEEIADKSESILDKDEVQEVQNLLKETEKDDDLSDLDFDDFDFDLDDDELNIDDLEDEDNLSLGDLDDLEFDDVEKSPEQEGEIQENEEEKSEGVDELSLDNLDKLEDFDFEEEEIPKVKEELADELDTEISEEEKIEETQEDEILEDEIETNQDETKEKEADEVSFTNLDELEDLDFEDDEIQEGELNIDDISDDDLESTIEDAVLGLSKEDLESELDEDALMDINMSDVNGLESLNTRDIKLAIGEKVEEEIEVTKDVSDELQELEVPQNTEISSDNEGVESLQKLLKALSDKDVAASLKGMKININITFGDK